MDYRVCPIFTALRPHLEDAYELAEPGTEFVVSGPMADNIRTKMDEPNGSNDANTRTTFLKLIKRAGLLPWPRLFHTLRASCETDLLERYPMTAVTEWLGHSAAIALKHYARVPEHLYEATTEGRAESGAVPVQNPVQHPAAPRRTETTEAAKPLPDEGIRRFGTHQTPMVSDQSVTLRGFDAADDRPTNSGTLTTVAERAAQNPAHPMSVDPLAAFVASLAPDQREALVKILAASS